MSVLSQESLLRRIRRRPEDTTAWLTYADWLEERGDPRGGEIRRQCRVRLPFSTEETDYLEVLAQARAAADPSQARLKLDPHRPLPYGITSETSIILAADLQNLCRQSIVRNFPRDNDGRLSAETVLLAPYASEAFGGVHLKSRDLAVWLIAAADQPSQSPASITIKLGPCAAGEHIHNWSKARWLWDQRHTGVEEKSRWGFPRSALRLMEFSGRRPRLEKLLLAQAEDRLSAADRVALSVLLLDEARFEESFALFGIRLAPAVRDILTALPSLNGSPRARCFRHSWPAELRRRLWEAAPWKMAEVFRRQEVISRITGNGDGWQAAVAESLNDCCLFVLPDQPYASKFCVVLRTTPSENGRPSPVYWIHLDAVSSSDRLPEVEWKRPLEVDIARRVSPGQGDRRV